MCNKCRGFQQHVCITPQFLLVRSQTWSSWILCSHCTRLHPGVGLSSFRSWAQSISLWCVLMSPFSPFSSSSFFFFFFFFYLFQDCTCGIQRFPGQGSNRGYSCWPTPDPQQHRIWATSLTYTIAHGNAGSLAHWARPGIEPMSSWILVRFINRWATTGTPPFSC